MNKQQPENPSKHKGNTKKANARKARVIKCVQQLLEHVSVCHIYNSAKQHNTAVYQKGKIVRTNDALLFNLCDLRHRWDITMGVFYRTQRGKHGAYYCNIYSKECKLDELSELVNNSCLKMFEEAPNLTKLTPFFIATPRRLSERYNDLNIAIKLAHRLELFNNIGTNFEINCNVPPVDYHKDKQWFDIACDFEWHEIDLENKEWFKELTNEKD